MIRQRHEKYFDKSAKNELNRKKIEFNKKFLIKFSFIYITINYHS